MPQALYQKILPGKFIQQIELILISNNDRCHRSEYDQRSGHRIANKSVSSKTRQERAKIIKRAFADLWQLGYRMQDPMHLKNRHVQALVDRWVNDGLSPSHIQTQLSVLRAFSQWIGKAGMVGATNDYCKNGEGKRCQTAKTSRAWKDNNVNVAEVLEKAAEIDQRFGAILRLQAAFGLRVKESIEMHPVRVISSDGSHLTIWEGTKGGRHRIVKVDTPERREAIKHALEIAAKHPAGRMRWVDRTWKQAQNRYYWLARRVGITQRQLGVTSHGLRHEYAQTEYRARTGLPSPIEGGKAKDVDVGMHRAAAMDVSNALGHSRLSITASYYGSYGHQLRSPVRYTFSYIKYLQGQYKGER